MAGEKHEVLVTEDPRGMGFSTFAKARPKRESIHLDQDPSIIDWVERPRRWKIFNIRRYRKYACGHRGPRRFTIRMYGRNAYPSGENAGKKCPKCWLEELKRTAIRCCLCGSGIFPGEEIALYDIASVEPKDWDVTIIDEYSAIGCMLWDCCPSGGFFAGYWNGQDVDSPWQ